MGHDRDGSTAVGKFAEEIHHLSVKPRIKSRGRFVEKQKGWFCEEL
jgi:hypothetical protein